MSGEIYESGGEPHASPESLAEVPKRTLDARSATIILLTCIVGQFVFAGLTGVAVAIGDAVAGNSTAWTIRNVAEFRPVMRIVASVAGGVVTVWMSFALIGSGRLRGRAPDDAAWVFGDLPDVVSGTVIGLIIGVCVLAFSRLANYRVGTAIPFPYGRMDLTLSWRTTIAVVGGILVAPPAEELLFRGILYGGYRKSFGPAWATVISTVIFVIGHLPRVTHSGPAFVGVTAAALAALWCRLRWCAIGPGIAAHFGYNVIVIIVASLTTLGSQRYGSQGKVTQSISNVGDAVALNRKDAITLTLRGIAHSKVGELEEAISDLNKAILLDPTNSLAYASRGHTYYSKREFSKAISDLNEAIRLSPNDADAYNGLGWILATCPDSSIRDGKVAVTVANKACELDEWKTWYLIGTLAAAHAEAGDFELAIKYERQAMSMSGLTGTDRSEARQHLTLYERREPYHELP